ncbi:MAG: SPL family radical SAM protein [Kosmotogaceae bacterium]
MIEEIRASRALTKSSIPLTDFTVNPYVGCTIGCKYCFARFIGSFKYCHGRWGRDVQVRKNIVSLLRKEITSLPKRTVFLSTACDPYQHIEEKYEITREILRILISHRIPVLVMSKSALVRRDIDLLRASEGEARVLITVTTDIDDVRKILEPGSSSFEERLETIDMLIANGIEVGAFVGPVLPMNATRVAFELSKRVEEVQIDPMNYTFQIRGIYKEFSWQRWLSTEAYENVREEFSRLLHVD